MIFGATEIEVSCILVQEFLLFIVHNQFEKILHTRKKKLQKIQKKDKK